MRVRPCDIERHLVDEDCDLRLLLDMFRHYLVVLIGSGGSPLQVLSCWCLVGSCL